MAGVVKESQENPEIMRRQEAHRKALIATHIGNTEEKQSPKQRISSYCNWSTT